MLLKCKKLSDRSFVIRPGSTSLLAALAITMSCGQQSLAQQYYGTASGGDQLLVAQNDSSSSMSDRIKKYMGDDGPQVGGQGAQSGGRSGGTGADTPDNRRERIREKLMQMPPEKREKLIEQMKERRRARGMEGGPEAGFPGGGFPPQGGFPGDGPPPGPPPGGPDGFPPPPPGGGPRGFRGDGPPEFGGGFRGGMGGKGIRNYGGGGGGGDKGMKGGGAKFFGHAPLDLTILNLTADQKTKIQNMRTQDGQKSRQIQMELKTRREKFKDMLFDPAATHDQILATRREISKLQNQQEDIMLNDFLGIRKLLTKEQLELLPQVRPEEPRRFARPSKRPGPPGPDEPELSGKEKGSDS